MRSWNTPSDGSWFARPTSGSTERPSLRTVAASMRLWPGTSKGRRWRDEERAGDAEAAEGAEEAGARTGLRVRGALGDRAVPPGGGRDAGRGAADGGARAPGRARPGDGQDGNRGEVEAQAGGGRGG